MTTKQELGTIEKVDIREVWPTEDDHFTPWLGENLEKLGTELGLDLELAETEAQVGTFKLDVRAHDANTSGEVVIENQFGQTDHSHLGQLLTYAGGFDAQAVIWIAERFRDEHREALDFLNRRTDEDTQFFGVEIELWKIGNSLPAPHFNVVVTPNEWRRQAINNTRQVSEVGEQYQAFFQHLADVLRNHNFAGVRRALPQNYIRFTSGFSNISYRASFTWDRGPRVELHISSRDKDWNKSLFDELATCKIEIENEVGGSLIWERSDEMIASRIAVYAGGGSIGDPESRLSEIRNWMICRLLRFKEVFGPRLAELVD